MRALLDPQLLFLLPPAVMTRRARAVAERRPKREKSSVRRGARFGLGAAFTLWLILGHAPAAHAQTYLVNTNADASDDNLSDPLCLTAALTCTLRAAIEQANFTPGSETIGFDEAVSGEITLTLGELVITDGLGIQGPGLSVLAVGANNLSRVFRLESTLQSDVMDVTIFGLTISNGSAAGTMEGGGGILNVGENLTLDRVGLTNNAAPNTSSAGGGGLSSIANCGGHSITIRDSIVAANTTNGAGAGLHICDVITLTIERTTISGNFADGRGGGLFLGFAGIVMIDQVTVSDNHSVLDNGGGIWISPGEGPGPVYIRNSTISGNTAAVNGGGIFVDSGPGLSLQHTTIAGNTATAGGGVYLAFGGVALSHTIAADGTASTDPDLGGPIGAVYTVGYSLVEVVPTSATFTETGGNVLAQDPILDPLANNGGPTLTHLPAGASPVINAGNPAFAPPPANDQRWLGFSRVAGGRIDIGSVERTVATLQLIPITAVFENDSAFVTLTREGGTDGAVSVTVTATEGTATEPEDYAATVVVVSWASGDTDPKTIEVPLVPDFVPEPDEALTITLSNPTGGAVLGASFTDTLNILNDDTAPVLSAIANQSIPEDGTTGAVPFTATDGDGAPSPIALSATSNNQTLVPDATSFVFSGGTPDFFIQVTPAANQFGSALITVVATDGVNQVQTTFTLDVNSVEDAPTITPIADQTIPEDGTTGALAFTIGDGETPASSLTVTRSSTNQALIPDANVVLGGSDANRTVTITPLANQTGTATITLTVSDGGQPTVTTFQVTVTPVDDPPTITAVANQTIPEDGATGALAFTIDDIDTPVASLTVTRSSSDQGLIPDANVVLGGAGANRTVTVTPAANQTGTATITLTVSDGEVPTSTTFQVTVTPVNDAPTISAIEDQTIPEDGATGALAFTIDDIDTAASGLTVTRSSSNQGLIPDANVVLGGAGANRTVTVTPAANQSGTATITLTVNDGEFSIPTTFQVTVTPVNDAPSITAVANQTVPEDGATGALTFTIDDVDTAVAGLTVTRSSSNQLLIPDANVVLGGADANRTVTITPLANQSGTATITLTVSDGALPTSTTFQVTVTPVNDAPTITAVANQTIPEDGATGALAFTIDDIDTAVAGLTVTRTSSNQLLIPDANVVLGGSGANRTVTITPLANQTGTATITLTVSDGEAPTSTTFQVTVTPVNDAPTITAVANQTIPEDGATGALAFTIDDIDSPVATLTVTRSSSNQGLIPDANVVLGGSGANRTVTITPLANQSGTATITLTVSDGEGPTSTTFQVTVTPVNDAPTITAIANQTIPEDGATGALAFTIDDIDTAVAGLTVTRSSSNQGLIPDANVVLGGSGASRTVTITPLANQSGTATITITVSDGQLSALTTFAVTVSPVNDPPTIGAIANQTALEDTSTGAIPFVVGDIDHDPAALTVTGTSSNQTIVANGNIVLGGSGVNRTVTITPQPNQTGVVTITLTVSDGAAQTQGTFTLTVTPANDGPTISAIPNQTAQQNAQVGPISFVVGDPDNDPASLTLQAVSSNQVLVPNANVTFGGSGANRTVTVTPATGQIGTTTITVTVSDGLSSAQTQFTVTVLTPVLITVQTPNGQPSFVSDSALLTLQGTASSSLPITQVRWTSDRGGSGVATLAPPSGALNVSWTATLPLQAGGNELTFIATDSGGRTASVAVNTQVGLLNYYLAEGATGPFFNTYLLIANPTAQPAPVRATYLTEAGSSIVETFTVPARTRITKPLDSVAGLESVQFTTTIASLNGVPLLIERSMFWDDRAYGGSVSAASEQLSRTWYFAEGSEQPVPLVNSVTAFDTYILLGNPGLVAANVTLQFHTELGTIVTRVVQVLPGRRLTVPTTGINELAGLSFATVVNADVPVIAERSQYFGPQYAGGHSSTGAALLSTTWNFAEGSVGPTFDTYFLVSNPGDAAATVNLTYRLDDGRVVAISRFVPPHARGTIRASDSVTATVVTGLWTSIVADRPVAIDRAMYWPGAAPDWLASHSGLGIAEPNTQWGFAEGSVGGSLEFATYLLLANPGNSTANVEISFLRGDGTTVVKNTTVGSLQRLTLSIGSFAPEMVNQGFGMVVRVTNDVPIFAERSLYWTALGVPYAEGSNSPGIRIP